MPTQSELGFTRGDLVATSKGAAFVGCCLEVYEKIDGSLGAVVEAIDSRFAGTTHVYPVGQLTLVERGWLYASKLKRNTVTPEVKHAGQVEVAVPPDAGGQAQLGSAEAHGHLESGGRGVHRQLAEGPAREEAQAVEQPVQPEAAEAMKRKRSTPKPRKPRRATHVPSKRSRKISQRANR